MLVVMKRFKRDLLCIVLDVKIFGFSEITTEFEGFPFRCGVRLRLI